MHDAIAISWIIPFCTLILKSSRHLLCLLLIYFSWQIKVFLPFFYHFPLHFIPSLCYYISLCTHTNYIAVSCSFFCKYYSVYDRVIAVAEAAVEWKKSGVLYFLPGSILCIHSTPTCRLYIWNVHVHECMHINTVNFYSSESCHRHINALQNKKKNKHWRVA